MLLLPQIAPRKNWKTWKERILLLVQLPCKVVLSIWFYRFKHWAYRFARSLTYVVSTCSWFLQNAPKRRDNAFCVLRGFITSMQRKYQLGSLKMSWETNSFFAAFHHRLSSSAWNLCVHKMCKCAKTVRIGIFCIGYVSLCNFKKERYLRDQPVQLLQVCSLCMKIWIWIYFPFLDHIRTGSRMNIFCNPINILSVLSVHAQMV